MKKVLKLFFASILALLIFISCASNKVAQSNSIYIIYTNDVHGYIDNSDSKTNLPKLRFSKIAKAVNDYKNSGKNVILVDAGDEIQGTAFASIDEGNSIIEIMNKTGYQLATIGNHEFDYGIPQFFNITKKAKFPYLSCNFRNNNNEQLFNSSKIFEIAGKKVAFIGITTPETITTSTPTFFQDKNGNLIYKIDGLNSPEDLYKNVQIAIDNVKDNVDFVIALGHLGNGELEKKCKISSEDVIANITGLDAFIDGHSHTTIESMNIADKNGKTVILTQTGAYLSAFGVMEINTDGKISTKLLQDYESIDENVAKLEDKLINKVNEQLKKEVAKLETELYINNPNDEKQRLIRAIELNAGDFVSDCTYWYFNENKKINCDVVLTNAGGIRNFIKSGIVTKKDIKNVQPFGNQICLIKATGQQIKDALEMGTTVTGEFDKQWNAPTENGGFMHVSGLRYTINPNIPSNVQLDNKGMFKSVNGKYRVQNIEIYNKETKKYEPIILDKFYSVGGVNYILRNCGNGLSMFKDCDVIVDYVGQDCEIMTQYMESFIKNGKVPIINTKNSPLSNYKGFEINYENPYGAKRITILEKNDKITK